MKLFLDTADIDEIRTVVEGHGLLARTALPRRVCARVIDQNSPHCLRRNAEEMGPVLPPDRTLVNELQERLVDERGRLERVVRALAPQVAGRKPPQFGIHLRQQPLERVLTSVAPLLQQPCDLGL